MFCVLRCPGGSTPCAPIHYEEVSDPRLPHDAAAEFAVGGDGNGGYDVSTIRKQRKLDSIAKDRTVLNENFVARQKGL